MHVPVNPLYIHKEFPLLPWFSYLKVNATGGDAEAWFMPDILVDIHKVGKDSDLGVIRDVSVRLLPFTNSRFIIIIKELVAVDN